MTGTAPIHRATMPGPIDYGYLCDLARVNGWRVMLAETNDGRHALRIVEGDVVIVGIRFPLDECRLDEIAETVFDELHAQGRV